MTIRRKVLLSLGILMVVLLVLALLLGRKLRRGEILAQEENAVRSDLSRVISALHNEIEQFDRETNTASFWAESAGILSLKTAVSPTGPEIQGAASLFLLHKMDILGFAGPGGAAIQARHFARDTGLEIPLPSDFLDRLKSEKPMARSLASADPNAWIMALNESPYLFVSHPAAVNLVPESAGGVLFAGRKIDAEFRQRLSRLSGLSLRSRSTAKDGVPADVRALLDGGSGRRTAVYLVSKEAIAGIIQASIVLFVAMQLGIKMIIERLARKKEKAGTIGADGSADAGASADGAAGAEGGKA